MRSLWSCGVGWTFRKPETISSKSGRIFSFFKRSNTVIPLFIRLAVCIIKKSARIYNVNVTEDEVNELSVEMKKTAPKGK